MAEIVEVRTLIIRDAVTKIFHILPDKIILHVDVSDKLLLVPEEYRDELTQMADDATQRADSYMKYFEIHVHADANQEKIGGPAQRIWEEVMSNE